MGVYINPSNETKEQWLTNHGQQVSMEIDQFKDRPKNQLPVILVDNGPFTAAAVVYKQEEWDEFTDSMDRRPKTIFMVKVKDLLSVCPELESYI